GPERLRLGGRPPGRPARGDGTGTTTAGSSGTRGTGSGARATGIPTRAADGRAARERCPGAPCTAMLPGFMHPAPFLALLLLRADPAGPVQEVPKQLPVGKYMSPSVRPEARPIGPTGTLGADVYRKRRKALMDKLKTGATLIVNEAKFEGLREGMDFYYLTGIDEPGAALLLDPSSPVPEVLFLRTLDVERGQWEGERAKLPSTILESTTGIAE